MAESVLKQSEQKHIKGKEFILYLIAVFFYTMISGTIASALAPMILYGTKVPIIQYVQAVDGVAQEQSLHTKIMLLFFYTVVHGLMMFLAGVPFFFYKLTGKTKEDVHNAVLEQRKAMNK